MYIVVLYGGQTAYKTCTRVDVVQLVYTILHDLYYTLYDTAVPLLYSIQYCSASTIQYTILQCLYYTVYNTVWPRPSIQYYTPLELYSRQYKTIIHVLLQCPREQENNAVL